MKKLTTRAVIMLLLVTTSAGSYIFLNTVAPESSTSDEKTEVETNELKALENMEATLPDAMLLKKLIEVGKRILPAS